MYTVEMLPAYLGDSLWIEYGDPDDPSRILIDGGLSGTADAIRRKIDAVVAEHGRCHLELLVVTHIDGDHIEGMVKLLGQRDLPLDIDDVWFNGRKHMPDPEGEDEEEFLGVRQAEFMSVLIEHLGMPWNEWRDGGTIYVPPESRSKLPTHRLPGGMELTLVSPRYEELLGLSKNWEKELKKAGLDQATNEEVLQALLADRKLAPEDEDDFLSAETTDVAQLLHTKESGDHSKANGASIAFVAEYEGASCLLTGDAWSPVLSAGVGRLAAERGHERLPLTALKVPHHGSKNNLHGDLLQQLETRRFLVSTDGGRFRHPDRPAIARMLGGEWRTGDDAPVDLYFNYRSESNLVWDDPDLKEQWNYRTHYPEDGAEGLVFDVADPAT